MYLLNSTILYYSQLGFESKIIIIAKSITAFKIPKINICQ